MSFFEVVGKYYWNPDGYDDYNDLTESDKRMCAVNIFRTVYFPLCRYNACSVKMIFIL